MKIYEIEIEINYVDRYSALRGKYSKNGYLEKNPDKDRMLEIFTQLGLKVKYKQRDKVYVEMYRIGNYSFEYYYFFNGANLNVELYIKRSNSDWPLMGYILGSMMYNVLDAKNEVLEDGYTLRTSSIDEIRLALIDMLPLLNDFRNKIAPHLENETLEW